MACKESNIKGLQERVIELEQQLAEAQAVIRALTPLRGDPLQSTAATPAERQEHTQIDSENIIISEAGVRRAMYMVPYPLMIRRDDGHVVMVNAAWTKISGYTLEEIPTIEAWTRKAYGEGASQRTSEILKEGFSQNDVKQWGEYEITTRSGEKRSWDFSTAPLGVDEQGRRLVMAMAVDVTERKKSEEELRAARDEASWLARFPSENPNPVVRVSDAGVVLYCNSPAASLRGWRCAVDAALSRPLLDLVELAIEQDQVVEQDVLLGDKFYSVSVIPLLKQGYLNLYGRDVTERKQAEKALAESERRQREITRLLELDQARLAAILQHMPVGVWIADQTGRLIGSNEQADRIWAGESPLLNNIAEYQKYESWYPESGKILQPEEHPLAVALRTGEPVEPVELKIRRFDGSEGTVLVSAVPIKDRQGLLTGAVGVNVDITERRLAEERFNKAFHASPSALVISRQEDGRIETINDMFVRFFGYHEKEVIGKTSTELDMFVNPADRQEAVKRLQKDKSVRDFELDVRLKSGEVRNASLSIEMINIGGKNMMLTAIQDVTLRRRAEEHIAYQARLLASVNDAIVGSDAEFRLTAWNVVAESMYGWKAEEVLGRNGLELLQTQWPQADAGEMRRIIAESGRWRGEAFQLRRDGTHIPVEVSSMVLRDERGQITGYVSVNRDITERKQVEQALRESEARYRGLIESQLDLIVRVDLEGRFTFVNDAYCQKFGLKREEILGRESYKPLVHPEDLPHTLEAMKALYQPPYRAIMEQRAFAVEGVRWIEWQDSAILDETGKIVEIQAIGRDITDRKQAEAALRESEQRLKRAQEIAHLGSWELDLINNRLTWSDEVYRIFGLEPQQFGATYEAFLKAVHPQDRAAVDNAYSSSIRDGRDAYEIEHRVVKYTSGEVRVVHEKCEHFRDQSGQVIRSIGMVHDITERKQAEEALRESEERFHSLADSMPQLVWTALPNGTVDYYNQRYQEYKEIKQMENTAWEWAPVLHPDDLQPTLHAWQRSVETGEIYQTEHRVQTADGSYRWHLSRGVPVHDESGQIIRWFGTATDIHDLKVAEEQLKIYAERLENSNRELEQFAFMASHDLQEPLRKIEMFGDMLLERSTFLDDQERNYIDRMRNASGRMRDMVEGLLQLSRVTTQGKPFVPVDLSQVASEVVHDLEGQIRRTRGKVNVVTLPMIDGDALQLHQLIQNLIGNALKYHQPGVPPEVNVYAKQLSGKVQILVEDKGLGFAQEDAERIFQPFQRLVGRSQYEGSGMGLAICRRIVERHGGEISVHSQPGQGATFIVTLPLHRPTKSTID